MVSDLKQFHYSVKEMVIDEERYVQALEETEVVDENGKSTVKITMTRRISRRAHVITKVIVDGHAGKPKITTNMNHQRLEVFKNTWMKNWRFSSYYYRPRQQEQAEEVMEGRVLQGQSGGRAHEQVSADRG